MLYQELLPFLQHQGFLFSFEPQAPGRQLNAQRAYGEHPVSATRVQLTFSKALDYLGINEAKIKERNIVFRSARRFAYTLWRMNGVPDHVVRAWTGH